MILGVISIIAAIIVTGAIIHCGWQAIIMFTYADSTSEFFTQVWKMLTSSWEGIVVIVFAVLIIISKLQDLKDFIDDLHDNKE